MVYLAGRIELPVEDPAYARQQPVQILRVHLALGLQAAPTNREEEKG